MKIYLISLKLSHAESTYTNLINFIKTAPQWAHPFESIWIVQTESSVIDIRDGVRERINKKLDKVLVVEILNSNWATFLVSEEVTNWMKKNLP
jgi:hypothetical protein